MLAQKYLLEKALDIIIKEGDDEVYGMWVNKDINIEEYMKNLRTDNLNLILSDVD